MVNFPGEIIIKILKSYVYDPDILSIESVIETMEPFQLISKVWYNAVRSFCLSNAIRLVHQDTITEISKHYVYDDPDLLSTRRAIKLLESFQLVSKAWNNAVQAFCCSNTTFHVEKSSDLQVLKRWKVLPMRLSIKVQQQEHVNVMMDALQKLPEPVLSRIAIELVEHETLRCQFGVDHLLNTLNETDALSRGIMSLTLTTWPQHHCRQKDSVQNCDVTAAAMCGIIPHLTSLESLSITACGIIFEALYDLEFFRSLRKQTLSKANFATLDHCHIRPSILLQLIQLDTKHLRIRSMDIPRMSAYDIEKGVLDKEDFVVEHLELENVCHELETIILRCCNLKSLAVIFRPVGDENHPRQPLPDMPPSDFVKVFNNLRSGLNKCSVATNLSFLLEQVEVQGEYELKYRSHWPPYMTPSWTPPSTSSMFRS